MAEVGPLVREAVLEELLAGEVLEVGIVDPALADAFVGQAGDVLEQQQPDHEAGLDAGSAVVAVERRNLVVDPGPVDLAGELHQLVLHVDDLLEPGLEQIASRAAWVAFQPPQLSESLSRAGGVQPKTKSQDSSTSWPRILRFQNRAQRRFRLSFKRLRNLHGRLVRRLGRHTPA